MKCSFLLLAVLVAVGAPCWGESPAAPPSVKEASQRLARESDTQNRVSGELVQLIQELGELVHDAHSNEVFSRTDGRSLEEMKKVLQNTDQARVRVAAAELRRAIENQAARAKHVQEAGRHVQGARTELTNLLRQANALMLDETIGKEIQDILREQQDVSRKTAQAGREKLQEQPLSNDPDQLLQQQLQIAKKVKKLREALQEALQEELTDDAREKLQQAQKIATEKELEQKAQQAVDDIDKEEFAEAFQEQEQTAAALREMADKIAGVESSPSEASLDALKKLLEEQTRLRQKTEGLTPADFEATAPELQLAQLNLAKELPQGSPAAAEMADAAGELEKADKAAAVAEQMAAEAALGKALEEAMGPGPGVPGAKGEAGTDDKGDGDSDKDEEGRGNMGKGKKGKGKKPGPPKENSEPSDKNEANEDAEPDENATIEPALAQNRPGRTSSESKPGERQFQKTGVEGKLPGDTSSTWTALSHKERGALQENFARELPREYREMLKVYFEELSK